MKNIFIKFSIILYLLVLTSCISTNVSNEVSHIEDNNINNKEHKAIEELEESNSNKNSFNKLEQDNYDQEVFLETDVEIENNNELMKLEESIEMELNLSNFKEISKLGTKVFSREEKQKKMFITFQSQKPDTEVDFLFDSEERGHIEITIDNKKFISEDGASRVFLIDLDNKDEFHDIIIESGGQGGSLNYEIIRYAQRDWIQMGSVVSEGVPERYILADGHGHLISSNYIIYFTEKPYVGKVVLLYKDFLYEVSAVTNEVDLELEHPFTVYFEPQNQEISAGLTDYEPGTIMKIIDYDIEKDMWYVSINGVKGHMCLQMAG